MRMRTVLMLVFFGLVTAFVFMNWSELSRTTTLNMGVTQAQGPLGLVMLGLLLIATILFAAYALAVQTSSLLETRSHSKEMKAQKELTENAEASRFTELRGMIERIENDSKERATQSQQLMEQRFASFQKEIATKIEQSGNTLAAYMGELEDRLDRAANKPAAM